MSFQGISSGLPTDQLIQAMLAQESAPIDRLQAKQATNTQKKTTLNTIKSGLTALAASIASLTSGSLNKRTVTSSDSGAVSATASGAASGSYDLVVSQLATKARLETASKFGSPTDKVAAGTYTITNTDGKALDIELDGDATLAEFADRINSATIKVGEPGKEKDAPLGVTASVVQKKPGEYYLVLSSAETGKGAGDGEVKIAGGVFTNAANVSTAAQNAKFTLNGVAMERSSNTIDDAVDGVAFTLNKAEAGKTVSLKVEMDTESIVKAFQDFVNKYNAVYQIYRNASGKGGNLSGDLSIQTMFSQLRSTITGTMEGAGGTASMAMLGMSTGKDGLLSLDTKQLEEALKKNPDMVGKVFDKASSDTKGLIDRLTTTGGGALTALISGIDNTNSLLSKQIENIQAKLVRREEVLKASFAKMEALIGTMQSAGQSLAALW
jgi:flagellar hook-associated protein 2